MAVSIFNPEVFLEKIRLGNQAELDELADRLSREAAEKYKKELKTKLLKMAGVILEQNYDIARQGNDLGIIYLTPFQSFSFCACVFSLALTLVLVGS